MKHEYLVELLNQNKTVIVPNLGAFSNNENPHHPYLFNEYLKFNDGMMAKHISSKEGITIDAAGEMIDKFTNELKEILAAGKEVVIPGIGTLLKKDGKTILNSPFSSVTPEKKETTIPKTIVPETPKTELPKAEVPKIEIPKKEIPIAETPKTEIPKTETPKVEVPKIEIPNKETPKTEIPKPEVPKTEIPKTESPKVEIPVQKEVSIKQVQSDDLKKEIPKQEAPKQVQVKAPVKEKKKSRKLLWIIILIILLGGGGTAGYIFREEIMTMVGMNEKTAEADEKKNSDSEKSENENESSEDSKEEITANEETQDSVASETETIVEETPEEETKTEGTPVAEKPVEKPQEEIKVVADNPSTPGNYYIIVGCFQEQAHADNMVAKISSAGLTPTNVGTFNGLQHIAAGSASDLESALQQATSIRSSFPKLWILKR